MQIRLFLAFTLIVIIAIGSVVLLVRRSTAEEIETFMFRGGMLGVEELVTELEACYQTHHNWEPCGELLESHPPMMGNAPGQHRGPRSGRGMQEQSGTPLSLQLVDPTGTIIARTGKVSDDFAQEEPAPQTGIPLRYQQEIVGYLQSEGRPEFTDQQERTLVTRLNRVALTAAAIAGGAALLLSVLLAAQLLKPVQELTGAARKVSQGDLSQRVQTRGDTELSNLAEVFNQMAQSLEQAEKNRKALTSDIAHELRTPLSIQQAYLEALQDGIYPLTQDSLAPIQEQNATLRRLVEDLRTLASADSGKLTLEKTELPLRPFLRKLVRRFEPKATAQNISLTLEVPEQTPSLPADPQRLEQILNNLLENALRFSPPGEELTIKLWGSPDHVSISIRDHGPGIPEEELPFVFNRFYRGDSARDQAQGGTGLGLSISRKLAEAHGGALTAQNHPQGGAEFILTLPLHSS
jgi:signal transduction histidine kinase